MKSSPDTFLEVLILNKKARRIKYLRDFLKHELMKKRLP